MNTLHEYQLQVPLTKQHEKTNEQSNLEGSLTLSRERFIQKQKKLQINTTRLIPITSEKLPRLSQSRSPIQQKMARAITEYQAPSKQQAMKFFKANTNTENEGIIYTDDERAKLKLRREEKKPKTTNYKAGLYENTQNKKFAEFAEQIRKLKDQLDSLQKYLNNSRKLFLVVRNIVEKRKNLRKILLKNGKDELVELSDIEKLCSVKEFVNINGEQKLIDKLNISLLDDIIYANEVLENLKIQNEILDIKEMADQVQKNQINRLNKILKINQEEDLKLSFTSIAMSRYNLHEQIETFEQRLGPLQSIKKNLKQTSQAITTFVKLLCDK
ncbi:unnamed protein product (macronuclear) [Paramecium tetraurelia]|uniref:Uncharacterized protein n=1 Tax=Paramecium tetraurelia TaxID=5888 RepID=A0CY44_PARTE|nr:uncharacterized protein GSPATT00011343001 [Paramecium tetraurelia]CAK75711.1 unnamed protein product [Paramecium tetraurelia]|eukprot:XP_001443108.1 hypothetical protein (macronuclear) [Paramecium tetraurelia strain d4-2]